MAKPAFSFEAFDIYQQRTVDYTFLLYEADASTELVIESTDVLRFKLWDTDGAAPDLDIDSKAAASATFTADAGTDVITSAGHGLSDGDAVRLTTTGTLPAGLSTDTTYWVISATTNTFQLATTSGGSAIDITSTGSGTHTWTQTRSTITVVNLGVANTTPAEVRVRFDQVDTAGMTAGNYNGELSLVDDSDDNKIKPLARGTVRLVGSATGNIGL